MEEKIVKILIKESLKSYKIGEVPVGCVIIKNNKIIATGHNTKEKNKCAIHHAEINAIIKACKKNRDWRLENCKLYVTLEPCNMCKEVSRQSRIHEVYYLNKSKFNNEIYNNITISEIEGYNFEKDNYLLKLKQFFINKR